ncbi:ATP-binding SpoIIE family protein phosphatase [Streptomyces sp. NBC_00083]|uniref:ATP-binding SpoIIE family protein phosphatase n=1 Tax=Streptomyces sp. NBC_00083 TaxID=2975647 RepID=UPI0022591116|nr:ATP-binding SpoIIE family protein phosphatase [Streptomyces sp. NBC_00083]MCX5387363.1 SpoIIE family protein phosphatase [Streptomyces sp. NBC_00083]
MTTGSPMLVDCEDVAWFRGQPEAARGAAAALGRRIGLDEQRTAQLVLAVAELAGNLTKHAVDGSLLLRVVRTHAAPGTDVLAGVEVISVDGGPGMADIPAALRDGMSTSGTLGIGLGAVQRLADSFSLHSQPGNGTIQLARFWPRPAQSAVVREPVVEGITRPISGEQICGDAWAARTDSAQIPAVAPQRDEAVIPRPSGQARPDWAALTNPRSHATRPAGSAPRTNVDVRPYRTGRATPVRAAAPGHGEGMLIMSCDGLGHGPLAALAAQSAVQAFRAAAGRMPEQVMEEVHRALRGTRGAAVAIARLEQDGRVLLCGIGNITAALVSPTNRTTLLSHPGIVGHQIRQLRTYENQLPPGGVLVMHSDGLSERWSAADLVGLLHHPPAVIATGLLRQAGTRRDDASVVIARAGR